MRRLSDYILARLTRVTSAGTFLPEVDGLRFLAVAAVFYFHVQGYLQKKDAGLVLDRENWLSLAISHGDVGVKLFFAVSGFILALPFATQYLASGKTIDLGKYYVRRVSRLEPPYFIHLLLLLLALNVALRFSAAHDGTFSMSALEWFEHLAASAIYQHSLVYGNGNSMNFVLWSLEVEIQFYILAPFLALVFKAGPAPRRGCLVAGVAIFSLVKYFGDTYDFAWISLSLLGNLSYFLVGFLLADLYVSRWRDLPLYCLKYDVISLVGVGVLFIFLPTTPEGALFIGPLIFTIYVGAFRGVAFRAFLSNPWIVTIGGMCYTIYMYHFLLISFFGRFTIRVKSGVFWLDLLFQNVVLTILVLLVCSFLFAFCERPFMQRDWPQRLYRSLYRPISRTGDSSVGRDEHQPVFREGS